jgi:hypothetical protein
MSNSNNESWIKEAKGEHRELFSELDVLLRSLDRFFVIENLPPSKATPGGKNFNGELKAALDVVIRVLAILDRVIPEKYRNVYWFQKFAESKLLSNRARDIMKADMYKQDTPEKSLYVLYDSFINLKSIISDILQNVNIQQLSYKNVGQLITKELRENIFFSPFKKKMDPDLDYIDNHTISNIVKSIDDTEARKVASIIFLYLFRFLRYMSHVDHSVTKTNSLSRSIVVLVLVRSEIDMFRYYMDSTALKTKDNALGMLLKGLSYQFSMETKRVYQQELTNIFNKKSIKHLRGKVENSHGILKNLTLQAIVQLARFWNENVKEEDVFDIFITRTGQSIKLRDDLYVLHRMINELGKAPKNNQQKEILLATLINYLEYFESFTFKLLRFDDFEEFSNLVNAVRIDHLNEKGFQQIVEKCHLLDVLISTTLRQIENREELKDHPLDIEKSEELMKQYLIM